MRKLEYSILRIILYVGIMSNFVLLTEAAGRNHWLGLAIGFGVVIAVSVLFSSILYEE